MKKRVWIVLGVLTILAAGRWWWGVRSDASYISRVSGVQIPVAAWPIDSYELDWCIVAKYRISKEAARTIAAAHSFIPLASLTKDRSMDIDSLAAHLEGGRSAFGRKSGFIAVAGRTKTNRWEFVIEPATGFLWAVVMFPDLSGDLP